MFGGFQKGAAFACWNSGEPSRLQGAEHAHLDPATARHDRRTQQDDDNGCQFNVNDLANETQFLLAHWRQLPRTHRLAP